MIKYRSHIISACALVSFGPTLACLLDITLAKNTNMKNSDALKTLLSVTKITQYYLLTALVKYYSPEHASCKKKCKKSRMIVEKHLQHAESWIWLQAHHQPTSPWPEGGKHVISDKSKCKKLLVLTKRKQANVSKTIKQHLILNWNIIYVNCTR